MAKPILVANWKNYPKSLQEAKSLVAGLTRSREIYKKLSFSIASPYPYFDLVSSKAKSIASLASQDISNLSNVTSTGTVTPDILKSFGVKLAIIGHSERRALGETDQVVSEKIKIAFDSGIAPLLCIGESSRDQDGEYFEFLRQEIKNSLVLVTKREDIAKLVIAYEPIWAIGKSAEDAIRPVDLNQTVIFIRKILTDIFGRVTADKIAILYGGSVEPAGAEELYHGTGVRGFLVGHASLDARALKVIAQTILK